MAMRPKRTTKQVPPAPRTAGAGAGPSVSGGPSAARSHGGAGKRAAQSAARREAILAAALDEFSVCGFAATRLDDVARRAGVAKGTIYLHFHDKEELFQELIRSALSPFVATIEAASATDLPLRVIAERVVFGIVREVLGTNRKNIIRLVLTEGPRFPKVAEFYYREVVGRAIAAMRRIVQRAVARGEISSDAIGRFPQLIVAPALVAVVWDGLFDRFEKLDPEALMRAHFDILFSALERKQ
ncbi:MAG TPA: TetR/AcrR family transcriptional regulator [Xanthobacteraceae bacterium]|jgi:AcrR family transcriptional regulator